MLDKCCANEDQSLWEMAKRIKTKFNKYFGNVNDINLTLFIACILDSWHKWDYVKWMIYRVYESKKVEILQDEVLTSLTSLFEQYRTGVCFQCNQRLKGTRW